MFTIDGEHAMFALANAICDSMYGGNLELKECSHSQYSVIMEIASHLYFQFLPKLDQFVKPPASMVPCVAIDWAEIGFKH